MNKKKQHYGTTTISDAQLITPEDELKYLETLLFWSLDPARTRPIAEEDEMVRGEVTYLSWNQMRVNKMVHKWLLDDFSSLMQIV